MVSVYLGSNDSYISGSNGRYSLVNNGKNSLGKYSSGRKKGFRGKW